MPSLIMGSNRVDVANITYVVLYHLSDQIRMEGNSRISGLNIPAPEERMNPVDIVDDFNCFHRSVKTLPDGLFQFDRWVS